MSNKVNYEEVEHFDLDLRENALSLCSQSSHISNTKMLKIIDNYKNEKLKTIHSKSEQSISIVSLLNELKRTDIRLAYRLRKTCKHQKGLNKDISVWIESWDISSYLKLSIQFVIALVKK